MAVALLIRGLDLVRLFDIVWALTQGGGEVDALRLAAHLEDRAIVG